MKKAMFYIFFLVICSTLIASSRDDESIEIGIEYDWSTQNLFLNSKKKEGGIWKEEALVYSSSDTAKNKIILDNKVGNSHGDIALLKLRNPKENEIKIYQDKK